MLLPQNDALPVNLLAGCFRETSASYKYYWFLSILDLIEGGQTKIFKKEIFAGMVAFAWYPIHYFRLSFGLQDKLQENVLRLKEIEDISLESAITDIRKKLVNSDNKATASLLWHLNQTVPHWFLSPWYKGLNKSGIYQASQSDKLKPLYKLDIDFIEIYPRWFEYLVTHQSILRDFALWNLTNFLQVRNPMIPDLPGKLIKPSERKSLTDQRNKFWNIVLANRNNLKCIYTGKELTTGNYVVDHFIPFNFISHDLIWNLVPAHKDSSSVKSDRLPPLDIYFDPFYEIHRTALEIIFDKSPKNRFLQDYYPIFPNLSKDNPLSDGLSKSRFRDIFEPLVKIAHNNGFEYFHYAAKQ
ncbi:MAG: hypothetical protein L6Q59_01995 [Ignavibacteriaceae bacterium]|nr:hypothetical protein [Ignavibacteriaceae bacterium]